MKRVFSSVVYSSFSVEPFFPNDFISEIYDGIHNKGGEVLNIQLSYTKKVNTGGEHLLIIYEDNNHYEEIEQILKDKRDDVTRKLK